MKLRENATRQPVVSNDSLLWSVRNTDTEKLSSLMVFFSANTTTGAEVAVGGLMKHLVEIYEKCILRRRRGAEIRTYWWCGAVNNTARRSITRVRRKAKPLEELLQTWARTKKQITHSKKR